MITTCKICDSPLENIYQHYYFACRNREYNHTFSVFLDLETKSEIASIIVIENYAIADDKGMFYELTNYPRANACKLAIWRGYKSQIFVAKYEGRQFLNLPKSEQELLNYIKKITALL